MHNKSSLVWKGAEGYELADTIRWACLVSHLASHKANHLWKCYRTHTEMKVTYALPSVELHTYLIYNLRGAFKGLVKVCCLTKCSSNKMGQAVLAPLGISGIASSEKDTAMGGLRHSFRCAWLARSFYIYVMFFTYLFKSLMAFKWKISCWLKAGRGIAGKMKCTMHNQIQMTCSPGFWGNEANEYSEPLVIRFEQPWQRERRGEMQTWYRS